MRPTRLVVVTTVTVTALLAGGTALAFAGTDDAAPAGAIPTAATGAGLLAGFPDGPNGAAAPGELSADQAAGAALAHVGSGRVTEIEREFEHGRREWKVEIRDGAREHDVRVDAATGAITRTDVDVDD